jgi:hypothetical protein
MGCLTLPSASIDGDAFVFIMPRRLNSGPAEDGVVRSPRRSAPERGSSRPISVSPCVMPVRSKTEAAKALLQRNTISSIDSKRSVLRICVRVIADVCCGSLTVRDVNSTLLPTSKLSRWRGNDEHTRNTMFRRFNFSKLSGRHQTGSVDILAWGPLRCTACICGRNAERLFDLA